MKKQIIIASMLATTGLAGAQMFAQLFGATEWTPAELAPVAWWKGEDNATDSAGAYNGTWSGTAAYADGKVGRSLDFNGSSAVVTAGVLNTSNITISAWIYRNDNSLNCDIVCKGADNNESILLQVSPYGKYRFFSRHAGRFLIRISDTTADAAYGKWEHVCIAHDGITSKFYIDGAPSDSLVRPGSVPTTETGAVVLGRRGASEKYFMFGKLDDVMIFNRALTAAEIKLLYDETVKRNGRAW